jgi:hypothetical protein
MTVRSLAHPRPCTATDRVNFRTPRPPVMRESILRQNATGAASLRNRAAGAAFFAGVAIGGVVGVDVGVLLAHWIR